MIYICLMLWIVYSIIEGRREAHFWHHRMKSSDYDKFVNINRHFLFSIQRGLMLSVLGLVSYYILDSILLSCYLFIMNTLIFSFFHNGSMYLERYKMSVIANPYDRGSWVYKSGWWDQSKTSTAIMTKFMTPLSRTIQAVLGVVGYVLINYF